MNPLRDLIATIKAGTELAPQQVLAVTDFLIDPAASDCDRLSILDSWYRRGPTPGELAELARSFVDLAVESDSPQRDRGSVAFVAQPSDGFDFATLVMLTIASTGLKVVSYGDAGFTAGSCQQSLLAGLGYDLRAPKARIRAGLSDLGYAYYPNRTFNPAFARLSLLGSSLAPSGCKTILEILEPMVNPGAADSIVIRCRSPQTTDLLSDALQSAGWNSGLVLSSVASSFGSPGQHMSQACDHVRGFGRLRAICGCWEAFEFGINPSRLADLSRYGVVKLSSAKSLLAGGAPDGIVDLIALDAAVAMWVAGRTAAVSDGLLFCRELLLGGEVARLADRTRDFFSQ